MAERPAESDPSEAEPTYRLAQPLDRDAQRARTRPAPIHPLRRLLTGQLPLEAETSYFILVNLVDFFVTYWLLRHNDGSLRFQESNPIARYFIESWGAVKGMLGFKLSVVTFVCLVAQLIALKREDLGAKVLLFGCLATGGVVIYSVMLYLRHT